MHGCRLITLAIALLICPQISADPMTIGPYQTADELADVIDFLDANRIPFVEDAEPIIEPLGYIVVTDVIEFTEARSLYRRLANEGVSDYLYIARGPYADRISVGVFKDRGAARVRANQLNRLGFEFNILRRTRTIQSAAIAVDTDEVRPELRESFFAVTGINLTDRLMQSATGATNDTSPRSAINRSAINNTPRASERPQSADTGQTEPVRSSAGTVTSQANSQNGGERQATNTPAGAENTGSGSVRPEAPASPAETDGGSASTQSSGNNRYPTTTSGAPTAGVTNPQSDGPSVTTPPPAADSGINLLLWLILALTLLIAVGLGYFLYRYRQQLTGAGTTDSQDFSHSQNRSTAVEVLPGSPLNNAVDAVSDYANRVLTGNTPNATELPAYLSTISQGGPAVLDLIVDIVELSRLETGQQTVDSISFDPESALQDAINLMLPDANAAGLSLQLELENSVPELLQSDPAKLQKIVTRLLRFAITHTASGRIQLHADYRHSSDKLIIQIRHAFSRPGTIDLTDLFDARSPQGQQASSIGLAVSKRLANILGGDITVQGFEEVNYELSIRAREIRKRQMMLPDGVTLDELIESEASNRVALGEANAALEEAEAQARSLTDTRAQLEQQIESELATRRSLEQQLRTTEQSSQQAGQELQRLHEERQSIADQLDQREAELNAVLQSADHESAEVETLKAEFESEKAELKASAAEAEAALRNGIAAAEAIQNQLKADTETLQQAQQDSEAELERLRAEHAAADQRLNEQADQFDATLKELSQQQENEKQRLESEFAERLNAQAQELSLARQNLDTLQDDLEVLRARETLLQSQQQTLTEDTARQIESLNNSLAQTKADRDALASQIENLESDNSGNADTSPALESLRQSLAAAEIAMEQQRLDASRQIAEMETELQRLGTGQQESEQQMEAEIQKRQSLEQQLQSVGEENRALEASRERLEQQLAESTATSDSLNARIQEIEDELQTTASLEGESVPSQSEEALSTLNNELEQARQRADEHQREAEAALDAARTEISELNAKLQFAQSHEQGDEEDVHALRETLQFVETRMVEETENRRRVEQDTAANIESLIDDVNRANQAMKQEAEARRTLEVETEQKVAALEQELIEARSALASEEHTRTELNRMGEFARDTSEQLNKAEARIRQLQQEKKQVEQRIIKQAQLLREARAQIDADEGTAETMEPAKSLNSDSQTDHDTPDDQGQPEPAPVTVTEKNASSTTLNHDGTDTEIARAEQVPASTTAGAVHEELRSTPATQFLLPATSPVARAMITRFRVRLDEQLDQMADQFESENYLDLLVTSNWIKSEAFKLGFDAAKQPIADLELALRKQDFTRVPVCIFQLREISEHIVVPDEPADDGSELGVEPPGDTSAIIVKLPANERKAELLENFVSELGTRLIGLENNWMELKTDDMASQIKWIDRYGSRMNLPDVTTANQALATAVEHGDADRISQKLWDFIALYCRLELKH